MPYPPIFASLISLVTQFLLFVNLVVLGFFIRFGGTATGIIHLELLVLEVRSVPELVAEPFVEDSPDFIRV